MVSRPKVSVIIPVYNREKTIARAIESVLSQTFNDYEIIIVDDGSTDSTKGLVSRYVGRVAYYYQENAGPSKARNTGIQAASGEWIAFLDSDDFWLTNKLEIQLKEVQKLGCGICFHDVAFRDLDSMDISKHANALSDSSITNVNVDGASETGKAIIMEDTYRQLMIPKRHFLTSSFLVKTDLIRNEGGFRNSLRTSEDFDLYFRLSVSHKMAYLFDKLAIYNLDPNRVYNNVKIYEDRIMAIKISLRDRALGNDTHLSSLAKKGLLYHVRCLAGYYWRLGENRKALSNYGKYIRYYVTPIQSI
jgi:glycosyltransferase involved in cell wall biosynthesis